MKLDEKIERMQVAFDALADEFGDYAVRRAFKAWARRLSMDKWRAQEPDRREKQRLAMLHRSVWWAAVEGLRK